ncbi:MAG TPA: RNase A-like domain-containing protein [Methylocystis sp.]|nr:RNase A-like domain-containing protein [Methylocystis sp.]
MDGIGVVGKALNEGDPARACIAAVFLALPQIPDGSIPALMKCAKTLAESGLLKASPDDPEHPGYPAGAPDGKGGQFRPKSESAVDLAEEEGGAHGGHAIRDHVGKSREFLIRATENSVIRVLGRVAFWKDRIGSFPSLAAANKLVNSTLAQNASIVDDVTAGRTEAATIESWFESPAGYETYKPSVKAQTTIPDTFGVRVRLIHDPRSSSGFRIFTAFPINPRD